MPDWSARVEDPSIQAELRLALTSAIEELPAAYRSVLVLHDVRGLSNPEIAELLGLSVPVVKTRVHRARLSLRKQLGDAMTTFDAMAGTRECASFATRWPTRQRRAASYQRTECDAWRSISRRICGRSFRSQS